MGLFKKKKAFVEEPMKFEEEVKTSSFEADVEKPVEKISSEEVKEIYNNVSSDEKPVVKLSKEEALQIKNIEYYVKNYSTFYGAGDVAQQVEAQNKAEIINLLFGILCELKKLNERN